MRFDGPSDEDAGPIRPKSILPPADRTSRAIRIKLFMLFGMLILVIVAMKEAGKPERWEWMGFEKPRPAEIDGEDAPPEDLNFDPNPAPADNPPSDSTSVPAKSGAAQPQVTIQLHKNSAELTFPQDQPMRLTPEDSDYPTAAVAFWDSIYRKLKSDQQENLLGLLKRMRLGQTVPPEQRESLGRLVKLIQRQRAQFHQQLFDQLALAADSSPDKTKMASNLYESQDIWDKKIYPAMNAAVNGEDFSIGRQQAVIRLQQAIDPLLLQQVQDKTSIGWAGDSPAWKRIWEKVSQGEVSGGETATHIQLMSQPEVYRGKRITIEGWVRSARKKTLGPDSELGLSHYYILWVRPRETKLGPYCVYSMTLPEGFPQVSNQFSDVNENVRISGYSFKVRTYVAADGSVKNSPVILARSLEPVKITTFTAVNQWKPSRTTLVAALILIPLIATGLAWWAFQGSQTKSFVPGKTMQQKIDESLKGLAEDTRVQTDREKVMSLYESDTKHD